jgi:hypothetical protein
VCTSFNDCLTGFIAYRLKVVGVFVRFSCASITAANTVKILIMGRPQR